MPKLHANLKFIVIEFFENGNKTSEEYQPKTYIKKNGYTPDFYSVSSKEEFQKKLDDISNNTFTDGTHLILYIDSHLYLDKSGKSLLGSSLQNGVDWDVFFKYLVKIKSSIKGEMIVFLGICRGDLAIRSLNDMEELSCDHIIYSKEVISGLLLSDAFDAFVSSYKANFDFDSSIRYMYQKLDNIAYRFEHLSFN